MGDHRGALDNKLTYSEALANSDKAPTMTGWFAENVLDPAMNAGPLAIYNTAAQFTSLPEYHLPVANAKPYTADWFVQGLSSGVGAALPFMLVSAGTGAMMRGADRALAGTATGAFLNPYLTSEKIASVAGAAMFGALQKPDETHTRLGNAVGMAAGFMVFNKGNEMAKALSPAARWAAYPAAGFAGGLVMAEASQLGSNFKFANPEHALQSAVSGMAMNTVMAKAGDWLNDGVKEQQAKNALAQSEQLKAAAKIEARQIMLEDGRIVSLDDLASMSKAYSEWVKENKPQYPTPEEFAKMKPEEIVGRGFLHPDHIESLDNIIELFKDKKPRPLPDAKVVAAEVGKSVGRMPQAGATGDIILGEWNMEFLTADKAKYFKDTYNQIVPKHHLLAVIETDVNGIAQVAKDTGYNYVVSKANTRGQAVGFLVNPRLKVLGTQSYDAVADVHGIPDLRPAFRVNLQDTTTGKDLSAVVVHLKSMRGGPEETAATRALQAKILSEALEPKFSGVLTGDWNTFLDKTTELDALKKAGFDLLNPDNNTTTQAMGGRLDGFFSKNLPGALSDMEVRPFFKNPLITRGLSDHGLLTTHLKLGS